MSQSPRPPLSQIKMGQVSDAAQWTNCANGAIRPVGPVAGGSCCRRMVKSRRAVRRLAPSRGRNRAGTLAGNGPCNVDSFHSSRSNSPDDANFLPGHAPSATRQKWAFSRRLPGRKWPAYAATREHNTRKTPDLLGRPWHAVPWQHESNTEVTKIASRGNRSRTA
jgi:hypothetical protein